MKSPAMHRRGWREIRRLSNWSTVGVVLVDDNFTIKCHFDNAMKDLQACCYQQFLKSLVALSIVKFISLMLDVSST